MRLDVMSGGGELRSVQRFAQAVESAGLDGFAITEGPRTAFLTAAAVALATDLHISTAVAVAFPRSPMITAQTAWELAETTGGKFRLGLGTQVKIHAERRYSAPFDPPGPRLEDYVRAVRAIFRAFRGDEKLAYEGRFYHHTFMPAAWSPGLLDGPDPAIDVAAVNPWMWKMAGRVADGVHVHPIHSVSYLDDVAMPALRAGALASQRDPSDIRLLVPILPIVGDTEEERDASARAVRATMGFYGATPAYAFQFDRLGYDGLGPMLNAKLKVGDFNGQAALLTDEVLSHFTVTSTWADLPGRLAERYADGRAHRLFVYLAEAMWRRDPATLERWGEVAAALR